MSQGMWYYYLSFNNKPIEFYYDCGKNELYVQITQLIEMIWSNSSDIVQCIFNNIPNQFITWSNCYNPKPFILIDNMDDLMKRYYDTKSPQEITEINNFEFKELESSIRTHFANNIKEQIDEFTNKYIKELEYLEKIFNKYKE